MLKSCKIVVKKETNKGIEYIFKEGNDVGKVLFCDNKVWCTRNGADTLTLSRRDVYCDSVVYLLDSNSKKGYLDLLKESEKFESEKLEKKFFDEDKKENIKGYYDAFYKVCEKRYQETHNSPDMLHQKVAQLQQTLGQLYQMVAQLQRTVGQIDRKI